MPTSAPSLLIVGGGHASMPLLGHARAWVESGMPVRLVNDHPALYYSGMVPETLGGVYPPDDARIDLVAWCARTGVDWTEGRVVALDPDRRTVATADGRAFAADVLVFDIGSRNPPPPEGADPIRTKPLHRIERLFTLLDRLPKPPAPAHRLVVVGGGAAGVEIALNVSGRLQAAGRSDRLRLTVVEASGRLLPEFSAGMGRHAERLLRDRGVDLILEAEATDAGEGRLGFGNRPDLRYDTLLWAAGSTGPALFREAGLACNERGYVRVERSLHCPGRPYLFAAGDCAVVDGHETLARVGVHAVKQGPVLRRNVDRTLRALRAGRSAAPLTSFRPYPVAPLILSTGRREGLMQLGPFWLRGRPLLRLKHAADLRWIRRYRLPRPPLGLGERLHARAPLKD